MIGLWIFLFFACAWAVSCWLAYLSGRALEARKVQIELQKAVRTAQDAKRSVRGLDSGQLDDRLRPPRSSANGRSLGLDIL